MLHTTRGFATGLGIGLGFIVLCGGIGYLMAKFPWHTIGSTIGVFAVLGFWINLDEARSDRLLVERLESRTPKA